MYQFSMDYRIIGKDAPAACGTIGFGKSLAFNASFIAIIQVAANSE